MRKFLIPTLFLICSCNPLRHYQKVVNDPFRNAKERELLARASLQEFPNVAGDTLQSIVYDSTEVNLLNDAYNALLDDYLRHLDKDTTPIAKREIDTVILNKIRNLKPATITKTITKEIKVRDGAWAEVKQNEVNTCREELRLMTFQKDEFKTKVGNQRKIIYYIGGFALLLLVLIVWKPRIGKIFPLI
jgi:hypothetical protein